jgi:thiamine phosphate synthase YjbQ (UPF0047 family)
MKSYRKELWFNITTRRGFVNITQQVEICLQESEILEGLILVSAMHILHPYSSTMMKADYTKTMNTGWKSSPRMSQ